MRASICLLSFALCLAHDSVMVDSHSDLLERLLKIVKSGSNAAEKGPKAVVNVAVNKPAWQASTYGFGLAFFEKRFAATKAVDGNRASDIRAYSCAVQGPAAEEGAWLAVDLLQDYYVTRVQLYPVNNTHRGHLGGARVYILSTFSPSHTADLVTSAADLCGVVPSDPAAEEVMECNHRGRYVVVRSNQDMMALCELEVFGGPVE